MLEAIRMEELINDVMRANPSNAYGTSLHSGHDDYYRLWDALERNGFKKLGNGNFSCVFEHHKLPNKVVKITFHEDFGYETWAKACMGEDNPYLPKIHYMNKTKLFGIYILDKLVPLDGSTFGKVRSKIDNGFMGERCGEGIDQVVDIINWIRGKWRTTIDLHSENMMQTVDGQVVITDPICIRKPHSSSRIDRVRGAIRNQPSLVAKGVARMRDMCISIMNDGALKHTKELLMRKYAVEPAKAMLNSVVIVPANIDLKAQARSRMRDFNQKQFRKMMFKKPSLPKFRA